MLQLEFIGYLAADAVQRTHEGKQFTCFNVGVTQRFKDRAGNKQERTKWINCSRACTPVDKYLKKGVQVYVRGDASARAYLNNQHEPQAELVCRAWDLRLLGKPAGSNEDEPF